MHKPRSVALVSAVVPYPRDAGKKVVLAGLLDYWRDRLGGESVHYVLLAAPDHEVGEFPVRLHRIARPRTREQLASLAWRTVATRRHTIQESMLYASRVRTELSAVLRAIDADLEIYDTIRLAQYVPQLPSRPGQRRVVYLDDLFSLRYQRIVDLLRSGRSMKVDSLGEFRSTVPASLVPLARMQSVQRILLSLEQRLAARREVEVVRDFSSCLLISPAEAAMLARRVGSGEIRALPPLVEESSQGRTFDGSPVFVLLGLLSLPHNHDAAMNMTRCMPDVITRLPDVHVRIVGRGARPELLDAAARFPDHVCVEGYVPDLDQLLSSACALIAPVRFGSGIKIKVLEALARGLPVLTTSVGAEGIASGPDRGVIVDDDLDRLPELMHRLTDQEYNATLSRAARDHYASTYARDTVFRAYDSAFGVTTASAGTGPP